MRKLLIVALVLALVAPSWAQAATARVIVTCQQPNANVFVDHVMIGPAPITLILTPGPHEIRVSVDENYMPFEQTVVVQPNAQTTIAATLERTSPSLYKEAVSDWRQGDAASASRLMDMAAGAPGKKAAEIPFYQGLFAERRNDEASAERYFLAFVNVKDGSATAHYHLGLAREALGQDALAATAYKSAVLRVFPGAASIMAEAGGPSHDTIARLQQSNQEGALLQLAYLLELKGSLAESRAAYRRYLEKLLARNHVDVNDPDAQK